jgi:hypothetical protein
MAFNRSAHLQAMFALFALCGTCAAAPPADEGIYVTSVAGDVRVTMDGRAREVKPGSVIKPPATIRTGRDGAVELRQGGTRASVASDTQVEIPALPLRGKFVEHIVQPRGNVFYDVAPRERNKLRVETPYLVAVIKGTQFNVASHPDSATVSLFEGRLEIWTPDGSDVVQLNAGEIATRSRGDARIRVLLMATGEALRASNTETRPDALAERAAGSALVTTTLDPVRDRTPLAPVTDLENELADTSARVTSNELTDTKIDLGADEVATSTTAGVDLGIASVGATLDTGLDLGSGSVDVAAGLDASVGGLADAALDTTAAVDLGAGTVDLGAGLDSSLAGAVDVGADVTAGIDLGAGTVDLGADAVVADIPVALDAGIDLGSTPSIEASVDLGPLDVDLGVDLVAISPDAGTQTEPGLVEDVVEDVVAPLRGLLGR